MYENPATLRAFIFGCFEIGKAVGHLDKNPAFHNTSRCEIALQNDLPGRVAPSL